MYKRQGLQLPREIIDALSVIDYSGSFNKSQIKEMTSQDLQFVPDSLSLHTDNISSTMQNQVEKSELPSTTGEITKASIESSADLQLSQETIDALSEVDYSKASGKSQIEGTTSEDVYKRQVVDKDAPVITLRETNVSMYRTDTFSCEAYIQSATDNVDGDLSKNVKCSSIDTTKDTQVVTYSVEDSQHNKAEATLNLHLSDKPAPTPDVIYVEVPSQGNNGSGQIAPSTSTSHGTQYFMFSDGYNLDSGYSACIATGSGYGAYSCEPIMGSDGLYLSLIHI